MIQIKQENMRIQVLDNEFLLASFSDISEATKYATLTEVRLKRNSNDKPSLKEIR